MKLTLALKYQPQDAIATAWLIPGDSAEVWLPELAALPLAHERLQLLVVGAVRAQPLGLLLIPPADFPVRPPARWQAYRAVEERCFLPVAGRLLPDLTPGELTKLLPSPDALYVWHPTLGLIAYPPESVLRVSDLLIPPIFCAADWNRAQPGEALARRLISIEPDETPTLEQILQAARGDIGDDSGALKQLPKHPDERSPLGKAAQSALGGAAKAIQWAAGHLPAVPGGAGLFGDLHQWASDQIERLTRSLEVERNKELARLLRMLDDNPDEGLRYALPLAGDAAPRGIAQPGARLTARDTNFNLGRLGGGSAVDGWDAGEYRLKLMQRYRELANRELALGRHRRAAYIFAELLADLTAAANALEQGGNFREAALLYEERLRQPLQAARSYAKGGLWAEAIAIYQKLNEWEKAGDLYMQIHDRDMALHAYDQAVVRHVAANDYLNAARLVEQKWGHIDEAQTLLMKGWPLSGQAARCLEESFALLARHQRHDEAERQILRLSEQEVPGAAPLQAIERLAKLASEYPHPPLRALAANCTRIMVAQRLEKPLPGESSALLQAVRRLVPGDRLLGRDTERYLQQQSTVLPRSPVRTVSGLKMLRGYHLPADIQWRTAVGLQGSYYLAGWRGSEVAVVQVDEDDNVYVAHERWKPSVDDGRFDGDILLAADPSEPGTVYAHVVGHPPPGHELLMPLAARVTNRPTRRVSVTPHSGASARTHGLHCRNASITTIDFDDPTQQVLLTYYAGDDGLIGTAGIDLWALSDEGSGGPLRSAIFAGKTLIGVGKLLLMHDGRDLAFEHLSQLITSIAPHQQHFAVALEQGALLFRGNSLDCQREQFAYDMPSPRLAFLESGHLVVAAEGVVEVYDTHGNRLRLAGKQQAPSQTPLAIVEGKRPYEFRVIFASGLVRVYRLNVLA